MEFLASMIGDYYGLDWLALVFGLSGSWCFTNRVMIPGFALVIVSCICGVAAATMADQMGYIVYNALLILVNMRGIIRGDRRERRAEDRAAKPSTDEASVPAQ